jgi:3-deoxy-7-phosphoheptulonate synthase
VDLVATLRPVAEAVGRCIPEISLHSQIFSLK